MFGRNNGDAERLAKNLNASVKATNRRKVPRVVDPSRGAASLPANLTRAVRAARRRGGGN
ncbi:hypothetical protein ACIO3O_19610 [Streptomyces sp. NPDC087440]|uniref:hypothetical protein n=1 Tax=Streptomyces sp. NPDC087440 TaxID=3365790 RepID=UPI003830B6CC